MIFVYPYKRKAFDFLISHSIRLVKHHYPQAEIVIIGDQYGKHKYIPFKDSYSLRGANVTAKLLHIAKLYPEFIFMNDDFLINSTFDFNKHHKHTEPLMRREGKASIEWNTAVDNTKDYLKHLKKPIMCYENHQPLLIESHKLLNIFNDIEWSKHAHFIKSLYCNIYPKKNITIDNCKLIRPDIKKANMLYQMGCLSIGDGFQTTQGSNYIKALI